MNAYNCFVSLGLLVFLASCSANQPSATGPSPDATQVSANPAAGAQGDSLIGQLDTRLLVDPDDSNYVAVPQAGLVHKTCIRDVPNGSTVFPNGEIRLGEKVIFPSGQCPYARKASPARVAHTAAGPSAGGAGSVSNYIEDTTQGAYNANGAGGAWYTDLESEFPVPPLPTVWQNQLFYIFSGLEPADGSIIMQPVLRYGSAHGDGGSFYTISAQVILGFNGYVARSGPSQVSPGYILGSSIRAQTGCQPNGTGCTYSIAMAVQIPGQYGWQYGPELYYQAGSNVYSLAVTSALESYNISQCSNYPSGTGLQFSNVQTYLPGPVTNLYAGATLDQAPWGTFVSSTQSVNCAFSVTPTYASGQSYPSGSTLDY